MISNEKLKKIIVGLEDIYECALYSSKKHFNAGMTAKKVSSLACWFLLVGMCSSFCALYFGAHGATVITVFIDLVVMIVYVNARLLVIDYKKYGEAYATLKHEVQGVLDSIEDTDDTAKIDLYKRELANMLRVKQLFDYTAHEVDESDYLKAKKDIEG